MITKITEAVEKSANGAMFDSIVFDEFTLLEGYGEQFYRCSYDKRNYKIVPFKDGQSHNSRNGSIVHGRFKIHDTSEPRSEMFSISFNFSNNSRNFGYIVEYSGRKYKKAGYNERLNYLIFILKGICYYGYEEYIKFGMGLNANFESVMANVNAMKTPEEFVNAVHAFEEGRTYASDIANLEKEKSLKKAKEEANKKYRRKYYGDYEDYT